MIVGFMALHRVLLECYILTACVWLHALCWLVIHFSWEKTLYMCCYVCFTLVRRVCICLCDHPYRATVCLLSASEYDPTLQAAPPWQHWEGQASTNTAECGDRGQWPSPVDERAWWRRGEEVEVTLTSFFLSPLPSNSPVVTSPVPIVIYCAGCYSYHGSPCLVDLTS